MHITGHRTRSVFDRYAIVAPAETRDALERVSAQASTRESESAA